MPPKELKQINDHAWELPASYKKGMHVPARFYGTNHIIKTLDEGVFDQITNVACLPGIEKHAICMPDGHWGYGFPVGGVAAFNTEEGIISPGGIGFDINCGMRLMRTNLTYDEVKPRLKLLIDTLFQKVPAGAGRQGLLPINKKSFEDIMQSGAKWCVEQGYGKKEDLDATEDNGTITDADTAHVSDKAKARAQNQLGTLGSGNHYLEVQIASSSIFDQVAAKQFGITEPNQVVVMFHCGSRGLGHQIGTDYLKSFVPVMREHGITIPDAQLSCAPFASDAGQRYFKAMACAANFAFANRQMIQHRVRESFEEVFKTDAEDMELEQIYDVAHNIAKVEKYKIGNKKVPLVVHRKGSTRSFGPNNPALHKKFEKTGQPVIVGGSMETGSYLLVGTKHAEDEAFGSTCHGSGRCMSRTEAKNQVKGEDVQKRLEKKGIYVKAVSKRCLAEEVGFAYKDINEVVAAVESAGLSKRVLALKPIGNVKG